MSLILPESVWNLQKSLAAKAKGNPSYRFYSLYDKICRRDVLTFAYRKCKANDGSAGVDGQSFEQIEAEGRTEWLDGLTEELRQKRYFCLGAVSKAYKAVDQHTRFRLRQWLRRKHKQKGSGHKAYSDEYLEKVLGLLRLESTTRNLPWAKAAQP